MNLPVTALRWGLASAAAGALLIASGATAGAATAHEQAGPKSSSTYSAPSDGRNAAWPGSYRGVQGGNLCLLARCTVGDSGGGENAGPSNTQGFNLCLLAVCTVRP